MLDKYPQFWYRLASSPNYDCSSIVLILSKKIQNHALLWQISLNFHDPYTFDENLIMKIDWKAVASFL